MAAVLPIDSRGLDGPIPTTRKNVTSASQKPSRQFGSERSGDRRDIGYARSGGALLYLVVNHRTHWRCCPHWTGQQRMSPALCASQYAERSRLPVTGFGGSKRSFLRVQPPDDRFEQLRRQIDWELTEGEIQQRRP